MAFPSGSPSNEYPLPSFQIEETPQQERQIETKLTPRKRGGYDCEFIERPKELTTDCPICLQILRDPFQVTCCGNSFCKSCVQSDKKSCPTCNEAGFDVFPDKRLRRSLYAFAVRCVHQKSGCEWIGELGELDGHLNMNPELGGQLVGCEFAAVACTHCCEYLQRRHVHAHESESCPQRPFSCDYCKDYGSMYEDVVNNHWPVCKCYPVPCPNECGVSPERQNVETHVNTVCPLTVVNCDFHYAGCEVQLVRKDMLTHLAESLLSHLSLLALHNQQLTQLTIQQKESLEESQSKIQELEKAQTTVNAQLQKCSDETKALKLKVRENVKQEVAILRRQQDEDRASLATLQQYVGILPFKITMSSFQELKKSGKEWYSPPFYTHPRGYKMCLSVDANGSNDGEGTHVSVFAILMQGECDDHLEWPFRGLVVLQLCNQLEDKHHCGDAINFSEIRNAKYVSRVTNGEMAESGWGIYTFISHNDLKFKRANKCQFLKDDCLHFRIIAVESLSEPGVLPTERTMISFEQHKVNGDSWYSPPFYTHPRGYKMCLCVSANGSSAGKGTHVSVFAYLMRGQFDDYLNWPFQGDVTLEMLNQLEDNNHATATIEFTDTRDKKVIGRVSKKERASGAWGYHSFIAHTELGYNPIKNCQYLKYDCLRFRVVKVELK